MIDLFCCLVFIFLPWMVLGIVMMMIAVLGRMRWVIQHRTLRAG